MALLDIGWRKQKRGAVMFSDKQGSGPPVVLIHGLGASSFSWRSTVAALSPRYTTYAVDLLGFGRSTARADFPYNMKAQAEAVTAFMNEQKLSNPIIIGHSMGGGICLLLAALAAKSGQPKLSKMVVVAPLYLRQSSALPEGMVDNLLASIGASGLVPPEMSQLLAKTVLTRAYADPSSITPAQIKGYADGLSSLGQIKALARHSSELNSISILDSTLKEIKIETLIIWGDADKFLGTEAAQPLERALPKASLEWVKNGGHIPQEEHPPDTNKLIEEFLN